MLDGSNPDPKFFSKTSFIQMGYGLWVSSVNILIGLALGFPSSAIPQLKDDAKFSIGPSDEAWIASVLTLVAPVGCIIGGYIMDIFGRRYALVLGGIPFLVGWISIGLSKSATHIIIGRIFTGVGCGMGMGTPRVYVTEISLPNMRGVIAVFTTLSLSFGLTLQALLGSSFKWNELCLSYGVFSAVISISSLLLPETPYYVLIKSTQNEAEKVLKRFRGAEYDTRNEITEMMDFKATNNISGLTFGTQIKLFVTRAVCLPFWIVIGYSVVTQLSGTSIIFVWTVDFLQASKVSLDSGSAHFFMELVRLGMGVVSAILMYKIGRRTQALISSFGVAVMCFVLGFLLLYNHSVTIYPFICYLLYVTFSTLGYYTLPFVMMYELYPLQVRGVLGGLTNSIINFMVFGVNAAFPFFRDLVGHAYILISFAMASILGTVFLFFCLPETKDLTLQEIEEYFNDLRPTLVSQRSVIAAQRSQLLTQTLESNALRSRSALDLTLSKAAGRKPLN